MKLKRYDGNPVLSPIDGSAWEGMVTANPGAWYDENDRKVHLLYRAASDDDLHQVCLGYAISDDGYTFKRMSDKPAVRPSDGFDEGCVEDPRIVKYGDWYFITYASRPYPARRYWEQTPHAAWTPPYATADWPVSLRDNLSSTGLLVTQDFKCFKRAGRITGTTIDDRDVILFPEKIHGKFVMLHRPMSWTGPEYGTEKPAMWISFADDLMDWKESRLLAKAEYDWERKIGGSTPPIKTAAGWLVLYHAVGSDLHYRVGAMLLDLLDPSIVTHRSPDWLMQPETDYELNGLYQGCIFPCGNVVINETLFVYYGGADRHVGVATCSLPELIDYLKTCPVTR
jgi:predicted GH43/DUF377 family glycosyl hydrolase